LLLVHFADCVAGLFRGDDERVGIRGRAGRGRLPKRDPAEKAKSADAIVIEIEMDQAGILWNVNVRGSENRFWPALVGRAASRLNSGGRGGGDVGEEAFCRWWRVKADGVRAGIRCRFFENPLLLPL